MERYVRLEEISDGRLYGPNDMVRADCGGCEGCPASCCRGMGKTIVLDPLDVYRMTTALGVKFEELLRDKIELNVADGLILPNLKMDGEGESCVFLNSRGRCSIHDARPGICRIFPLGRYYEDRSFRYFLQTQECLKENRAKIKVKKWIDTPELEKNQKFIADWHYFLKDTQYMLQKPENETRRKEISMYILTSFYMIEYRENEDFYAQVDRRMKQGRENVGTGAF